MFNVYTYCIFQFSRAFFSFHWLLGILIFTARAVRDKNLTSLIFLDCFLLGEIEIKKELGQMFKFGNRIVSRDL
jgi:hypothetical protein